jgi:2-polyprenyl-3-methyl-5-hydroxy-6-metoxy-1,4-benzoquinol methylase
VTKLGLSSYKKKLNHVQHRLNKIKHLLQNEQHSLLEIGASEGAFLQAVKRSFPRMHVTAVDQDQNTLSLRSKNADENYDDLDELIYENKKYDVICFFHVLEHILSPADFLASVNTLMQDESLLIVEVPSLYDPLLSLYKSEVFARYYFQSQHPYIYSQASLQRLLEYNGFQTLELLNYQRYGLENHLNWLANSQPGGNELFHDLFQGFEADYKAILERCGKTDTVIWVGQKGTRIVRQGS